ncbi:MAG: nitroreductase family protein [Promethearchaeota archaeon]
MIKGINYEKCNSCYVCVFTCPECFKKAEEQNKIIFDDPQNQCSSCGRCICKCQKDAILYENMGEFLSFEGVENLSTLMPYEKLHNFMISKRSIRSYKKKKVPRTILEKVLNSMRYAPAGANMRTLKCTIISGENKIKRLSEAIREKIISSNPQTVMDMFAITYIENAIAYAEGMKKTKEAGIDPIFYNAPVVMIIHSDYPADDMNATIALTYGMFSAQSLGLGSCWIGLAQGVFSSSKEIQEEIAGVKGKVWGVITLGYFSHKFFYVPPRPPIPTTGLEELE